MFYGLPAKKIMEKIKSKCVMCGVFYLFNKIPKECYICGAPVEEIDENGEFKENGI